MKFRIFSRARYNFSSNYGNFYSFPLYTPHRFIFFKYWICNAWCKKWLIFTLFTFKYCFFFFFFMYLHVLKALLYKSYQNTILWVSGLITFFLSAGIAFLGYVLPWGQMSLWGATVITNLITAIPVIGNIIIFWVWGGFSINNSTLNRFFILHVIVPFLLVGLVISHINILHIKGSSSPLGTFLTADKIAFFPYYTYKDFFGFFWFFLALILFIAFSPNFLVSHPDNYIKATFLITPLHIVPEWYFLAYYAVLRAVPSKLGGVLAMGGSMAIFFFLGSCDSSLAQALYFKPFLDDIFFIFFLVFIFLKVLGGLPIKEPFAANSQILAIIYFSYLIYLLFILTKQEQLYYFFSYSFFQNKK